MALACDFAAPVSPALKPAGGSSDKWPSQRNAFAPAMALLLATLGNEDMRPRVDIRPADLQTSDARQASPSERSQHRTRLNRLARRDPRAVLGVLDYWLAPQSAAASESADR